MDSGLGTPASPGFGVKGLVGDGTLTAGAKRFCCVLTLGLGLAVRFGGFGAAAATTCAVSLGRTKGFGRRGGWSAAGSVDVIGSLEACIGKGIGKGVAGAATVTAGTASGFPLVLGEAALVAPSVWGAVVAVFALLVKGGGLLAGTIGGFAGDGLAAVALGVTAGGGGGAIAAVPLPIASFTFVGDPGKEEGSPEVRRLFRREYRCFESSLVFSPPSSTSADVFEEEVSATLLTRAAVNIWRSTLHSSSLVTSPSMSKSSACSRTSSSLR